MFRHLGQVTNENQLDRIYNNLRLEYKMYIRQQDFQTLPQLVLLIEQFEELLREHPRTPNHVVTHDVNTPEPPRRPVIDTFIPPPTFNDQSESTRTSSSPNPFFTRFNRESDCWRCGQRGHTRHTCHNPRIPLCSQCGRIGQLQACPCQSGNGIRGPTNEQYWFYHVWTTPEQKNGPRDAVSSKHEFVEYCFDVLLTQAPHAPS